MNLSIGLSLTRPSGPLGFNPASLFASGEVGAWYDPSDSSTVFQDAAGTTPAGVGDPVGLILDKSQGGPGPQLFTDFSSEGLWTDNGNGSWSISNAASNTDLRSATLGTTGTTYEVSITFSNVSGSLTFYPLNTSPRSVTSSGTYTSRVVANGGVNNGLWIRATAGATATVSNISVRELPGNHATQSGSTKRPVLQSSGGLYYLDFDGADDWMRTTFGAAQAQPNTIAAALKFDQGSRNEFVVDGVSTNRNAIYKTTTDLQLFAGSSITDPSAAGTTELVALGHLNTTSSELRVDGSQVVTGDVGSNQWGGITLGADSSDTLWLDGRIYGFIGVNRTLTASEIDGVESYLAAKSGVTI